jgi:hypothetical protein
VRLPLIIITDHTALIDTPHMHTRPAQIPSSYVGSGNATMRWPLTATSAVPLARVSSCFLSLSSSASSHHVRQYSAALRFTYKRLDATSVRSTSLSVEPLSTIPSNSTDQLDKTDASHPRMYIYRQASFRYATTSKGTRFPSSTPSQTGRPPPDRQSQAHSSRALPIDVTRI